MTALAQVAPPYPVFADLDGKPLDAGYIYIGFVNTNPELTPIPVFWDPELTLPAPQPIRTVNGYPSRNGTPAALYADGTFSVLVRNKKRELVIYAPVGYAINPDSVASNNDITTIIANLAMINTVAQNMAYIQAAPAAAAAAQDAAAYLESYIDQVVMNVTFPLDLGLVTDPVIYNHFDLGAL